MNKTRTRILSLLLTAVMVLSLLPTTIFAAEPDGDIEIGTAAAFIALTERNFSEISTKTIKLTADIDMAGQSAISPIGGGQAFNGTFDGQGYVIRNLKVTSRSTAAGLFGQVGPKGMVCDLGLENIEVTAGSSDGTSGTNTGAIAGALLGTVTRCAVTGSVTGWRYTGGIAGLLYGGTIENCWVDLAMDGSRYCGGLFGGTRYDTEYSASSGQCLFTTAPKTENEMVVRNNLVMGTIYSHVRSAGLVGTMDHVNSCPLAAFEGNVSRIESLELERQENGENYYGPLYANWSENVKTKNNAPNNLYSEDISYIYKNSALASSDTKTDWLSNQASATADKLATKETYENLGWDYNTTWYWDEERKQPMLRGMEFYKVNEVREVHIDTTDEFLTLCNSENFTEISNDIIYLDADIDITGQNAISPIGGNLPFNGTFDGQGHAIKNLTIVGVSGTNKCTGLFGYVGTEGKITNLGLDCVDVTGHVNTGAFAGCLTGEVSKCYVTGTMKGMRYTGGIAGMLYGGTIENCWTDLAITGSRYYGGLIGGTRYDTRYSDEPSSWTVYTPISEPIDGIAMVMRNNLTLGTLTGNRYAGGFLGDMANAKTTQLDTFEGNVSWVDSVESVALENNNSYYDPYYGKWVKARQIPTINYDNLYWDKMSLSGKSETIVPTDSCPHADLSIKAATAEELVLQKTYEALGWDFEDTWGWSDKLGHPVLQGQTVPADPDDAKKYPASVVTTYVDSPKTSRAFTWNTINSIEGTIVQAVEEENYNKDNPRFTISKTGTSYELMDKTGASTGRNIHKVNLTGLEPGTTYYYRVGDGEYWSPVYSFTTEWEDADSFTFFSITDTQDQYQNYKTVLEHATENYPEGEFILHSGDVIQNNITGDYDEVYRVTANYVTNLPSMVTPGNHELNKDSQATTSGTEEPDPVKGIDNYKAHYQFPNNGPAGYEQTVYSFTYGDAYFAVLNSNISLYNGTFNDQIDWLKADMAATGSSKAWQIVSIHHGPYNSSGNPTSDAAAGIDTADAGALIHALEELGIDLVIYGHYHQFRGSGTIDNGSVYYYSPGCSGGSPGVGSGAPIYAAITITEDTLTVKSHVVPVKSTDQEQVINNVTQTKSLPPAVLETAPTAADGLTYTGQAQALVTAGTATAGTMLYSLDGKTYSGTIPTATNAGTYTVYYKAGGIDYSDTEPQTISDTIAPKSLNDSAVADIDTQYYRGSAVEPALTVMDGSSELTEGTDYTVAYSNNTAAGTATATVTFQGNYTGSATKTFSIVRRSSNNSSTTYLIEDKTASSEEGTVTIRPKRAERGTTVSITVTPDTGYVLDKLIVTDKNGNELKVTAKGNGKYSFTMPASQVAVKATFKSGSSDLPFADVSKDDWFYSAVEHVYAQGIMIGTGSTTFTPNADLSRAMVAQILYKLDSDSYDNAPTAFLDNPSGSWFYTAVNWAAAEGVVAGYGNGLFGPMDSVTREQLAVILRSYAVSKGYPLSGSAKLDMYVDADETSFWAVDAMEWAAANNILRSNDGRLAPTTYASRADVAFAMMQFCENIVK